MKARFLTIAVLALGGLLLVSCSSGGEPDISLAQQSAQLGVVTNGEVRGLTTEVLNRGQAPLIIEAVTTSCGCTSATVEPATIPAGGTGTLKVTYDSGAHGPEFAGPIERQVFIASNDPDQREAVFELSAEVVLPDG